MPPLRLEVFETATPPADTTVVTDIGAMEEARLAAYEQGYTAGWDDATAAQAEDQTRLRADIGRNLQALGFTYQEARTHLLRAVEPLLLDITASLLPVLAREALAPVVLETLMPLAEQAADAPVRLVLNPSARPAVEGLVTAATGLPLTIVEEPTLGEGQVYLRLGETETQVDLDRAVAAVTAALRDFFALSREEAPHG
jgi:flagellar assembly protein FliH